MLAQQTAVDDDPMRMLAGVPARHVVRNRLAMVMVRVVVTVMIVSMVVMAMIFGNGDR